MYYSFCTLPPYFLWLGCGFWKLPCRRNIFCRLFGWWVISWTSYSNLLSSILDRCLLVGLNMLFYHSECCGSLCGMYGRWRHLQIHNKHHNTRWSFICQTCQRVCTQCQEFCPNVLNRSRDATKMTNTWYMALVSKKLLTSLCIYICTYVSYSFFSLQPL